MKLLFPAGGETEEEVEELLKLAMECRKRVKDQLKRIDATYPDVEFSYEARSGIKTKVQTLEEIQFPAFYHKSFSDDDDEEVIVDGPQANEAPQPDRPKPKPDLSTKTSEDHIVFLENQKGVSFDKLFGAYFHGATEIRLTDPYLRVFHQIRNLMELVETLIRFKAPEDDVSFHIITSPDDMRLEQQIQYLEQVKLSAEATGVNITWELADTGTIHARHITTNTGWKILLDRGLDVFQRFEMNDAFSLANRIQEQRACKGFELTYIREPKILEK